MTTSVRKPLLAPVGAPPRPTPEGGNHIGRLYSIVDLGTHLETIKGDKKVMRKFIFTWELPELLHNFTGEGVKEPFAVSNRFTYSMNAKANLRKFIDNWRGKPLTDDEAAAFDIGKMLGQPCLVNLIVKPKTEGGGNTAYVGGCSKLMKGQVCPKPYNRPVEYRIEYGQDPTFKELPEWQQKIIMESHEFKGVSAAQPDSTAATDAQADAADDAPPF